MVDELELRLSLRAAQMEIERRAEIERTLQEANLELERVSQTKSAFLANTSHELRTPLSAILGFSELLAEEIFGPLNEKQMQYVRDIHDSGQHLLALINDILDLSKVEVGKMTLKLAPIDVPELAEGALTVIRETATQKSLSVALEGPTAAPPLLADGHRVKQVLYNLLSNAVKFTPAGGSVRLTVEDSEGAVSFKVEDTGIGISEEDQAKLFQPFPQVDGALSRSGESTGLGLMLSKCLVELHSGRMWLKSELGEGSTFGFAIPRNHHGTS